MIAGLVTMTFAAIAALASVARLNRVLHVLGVDLAPLTIELGRSPLLLAERVEKVARLLRDEGALWEASLFEDMLESRSTVERTALVNEHLADLDAELRWGAPIPGGAARASLLASFCAIFVSAASQGLDPLSAMGTLAWGAAGTAVSLAAGREANRVVRQVRADVDRLVARTLEAFAAASDR